MKLIFIIYIYKLITLKQDIDIQYINILKMKIILKIMNIFFFFFFNRVASALFIIFKVNILYIDNTSYIYLQVFTFIYNKLTRENFPPRDLLPKEP
jgi:hypothetical protein